MELMVACLAGLFAMRLWQKAACRSRFALMMQRIDANSASTSRSISIPKRVRHRNRRKVRTPVLAAAELGLACSEVAARLRAGVAPDLAWRQTLVRLLPNEKGEILVENTLCSSGQSGKAVLTALRFSESTGAPLAVILDRCAEAIVEMERAEQAREVAFAGPRLSAKVLTALPLVGLFGAELLGAAPVKWFFSGTTQGAVFVVGVMLALGGHLMSLSLIRRASSVGREQQEEPLMCDLCVAGLNGGQGIPALLTALGQASGHPSYARVGKELQLGASWQEAWSQMPTAGALLHRGMEPAWCEGIAASSLLQALALQSRAQSVARARQAAEKLGVTLALPLGLLLLPSFVILTLVPLFFSLVGGQLGDFLPPG